MSRGPSKRLDTDTLPPHSMEAEQGVLGCCLLNPKDCIDQAAEALASGEEFYDLRHALIWRAIKKLGDAADVITLQQELKATAMPDDSVDAAFLVNLQEQVPSAANIESYTKIVREKYLLRKMVQACMEVLTRIEGANGDTEDILTQCEQNLTRITETRMPSTAQSSKDVVVDVITNVLEKFRRGVKYNVGPSLGFNYLDNIIPGLGAGQFIIIAARPSTGKSALMAQIAENVAGKCACACAIFSLEMTSRSLMLRNIFQKAGANLQSFLNGFMTEEDVPKLSKVARDLAALPIFYDESARMSIEEFEIKAKRLVRKNGVKVIFIDYLQLMFARVKKERASRAEELGDISMRLKALAKELAVPIVALAQMNREIEKETHRRPRLSDLKDCGNLEQDADIVMFLWKPDITSEAWERKLEIILPRVKCPREWRSLERNDEGKNWKEYLSIVNCTVEKQREGRSNVDSELIFIKPWVRFEDAYRPAKNHAEREETTQTAG